MGLMDPNAESLIKRLEGMVVEPSGGMKDDAEKPQWRLLPWDELEDVVRVLTFGANKYAPENWKKVSAARYEDATFRHLKAYMAGELLDTDSGLPHLAHAVCDILFLMWKDKRND